MTTLKLLLTVRLTEMRFLSFPLVALAIIVPFILMVGSVANATRPVVTPESDKCSNLSGVQTSASNGITWRWKVKTPERGDCRGLKYFSRFPVTDTQR